MPLPRTSDELSVLRLAIVELMDIFDQSLSHNFRILRETKVKVNNILKDNFLIPKEKIDALDEVQIDFFREEIQEFEDFSVDVDELFVLFLKIKKIKNKLNNIILSDSEVNQEIQAKFCKVITEYGEGTGYLLNDKEGVLISSFHLVGAIKPIRIEFDQSLTNVLCVAGYVDNEFRLTEKSRMTDCEEQIREEITKIDLKKCMVCTINSEHIHNILAVDSSRVWIDQKITEALKDPECVLHFSIKNNLEKMIAVSLQRIDYLDENFSIANKMVISGELQSIIERLKSLKTESVPMTVGYEKLLKDFFFENIGEMLQVFKRGRNEKDVVLLSEDVEIQCGDSLLLGKVDLPEGIHEDEKRKILTNFAYFDSVPIRITHFKELDTLVPFKSGTKIIYTGDAIQPLSEHEYPTIGERIYFGGYPLTQQVYTFSVGMIASMATTESRRCFVIEAPIAPGNSGSPVFVQRKGEIYWIGIINSEVAHVSEKMLEIREKLQTMPESVRVGGVGFSECFRELTTTLLDNLSTGKGKAFDVRSVQGLSNRVLPTCILEPYLDFLVPKPRKTTKKLLEQSQAVPVVFSGIAIGDEIYYTHLDGHASKHTEFSKRITKDSLNHWGKKPATFRLEVAEKLKEILERTILAIMESNPKARYARFTETVGWDEGEETAIVELYYGDRIGSHIRPKAESRILREDIVDVLGSVYSSGTYTPHRDASLQNTQLIDNQAIDTRRRSRK